MARKILCVDDLGEGFCYDSTTEKIDVTASGIECADVFPNNPNDCATPPAIQDANGNVTVLNGNGNIPTDCTLEVTGGVLGVTPIVVNPPIAIDTFISTGVIGGLISSGISSANYTNQSTCRDVLIRVVSRMYVNRQLSASAGVNGNMTSTHVTLFDNGSGSLIVDNIVVPQMSNYGPASIDYNLITVHSILVPANSTITIRTQSQVQINSASNYAGIAVETRSNIYVITEGYVN